MISYLSTTFSYNENNNNVKLVKIISLKGFTWSETQKTEKQKNIKTFLDIMFLCSFYFFIIKNGVKTTNNDKFPIWRTVGFVDKKKRKSTRFINFLFIFFLLSMFASFFCVSWVFLKVGIKVFLGIFFLFLNFAVLILTVLSVCYQCYLFNYLFHAFVKCSW